MVNMSVCYFGIPVIIEVHGHRFEIYMLVSEIHENVDLVLGIKNIFKLEGVINSQVCCFKFLSRSLPIFPKERVVLTPKEQKLMKVEAPFIDGISGLAIIKILDGISAVNVDKNCSDAKKEKGMVEIDFVPTPDIVKEELSQKIPGKTEIETEKTNQAHSKDPVHIINNADTGMTHTKSLIPDVTFHPGPTYRPPPKPIRSNVPRSQESSQIHQV